MTSLMNEIDGTINVMNQNNTCIYNKFASKDNDKYNEELMSCLNLYLSKFHMNYGLYDFLNCHDYKYFFNGEKDNNRDKYVLNFLKVILNFDNNLKLSTSEYSEAIFGFLNMYRANSFLAYNLEFTRIDFVVLNVIMNFLNSRIDIISNVPFRDLNNITGFFKLSFYLAVYRNLSYILGYKFNIDDCNYYEVCEKIRCFTEEYLKNNKKFFDDGVDFFMLNKLWTLEDNKRVEAIYNYVENYLLTNQRNKIIIK